jgi:predicted SAM-dependent methyltransferase
MVQMNELVLNIGSGHKGSDQMLNVDIRELPNVDIVADATDIRLPKGIAQGVFSSHVLEHFPHENLRRVVLLNWVGLLCEGGFFRAVVPDAEAMMAAFTRGDMSFDDLRTVTFGLQEYNGDIHYTMFSKDSLKLLLEEAGLHDIRYVATSRRNGLCLEMEVLAYK